MSMADFVEITDDGSDMEPIETHEQITINSTNGNLDELYSLKREMELRGSLLGKTWSELSRIMSTYQGKLIKRHAEFEASINTDDHERFAKLEFTIEKKTRALQKMEKNISDLENKVLEKDGEIVRLRTEVHKLRNEVTMKDSLIQKLQNQMAKEAMEYAAEISSLKEMLEANEEPVSSPGIVKKRRITPTITSIAESIPITDIPCLSAKSETTLNSCALSNTTERPFTLSVPHLGQSAFPTNPPDLDETLAAVAVPLAAIASTSDSVQSFHDNHFIKMDEMDQDEEAEFDEEQFSELMHPEQHDMIAGHPLTFQQANSQMALMSMLGVGTDTSGISSTRQRQARTRNPTQPVIYLTPCTDKSPSTFTVSPCKEKRRAYEYDTETRERIAKLAMVIGDRATARVFSRELGVSVHYWTVYNFKKQYKRKLSNLNLLDASELGMQVDAPPLDLVMKSLTESGMKQNEGTDLEVNIDLLQQQQQQMENNTSAAEQDEIVDMGLQQSGTLEHEIKQECTNSEEG